MAIDTFTDSNLATKPEQGICRQVFKYQLPSRRFNEANRFLAILPIAVQFECVTIVDCHHPVTPVRHLFYYSLLRLLPVADRNKLMDAPIRIDFYRIAGNTNLKRRIAAFQARQIYYATSHLTKRGMMVGADGGKGNRTPIPIAIVAVITAEYAQIGKVMADGIIETSPDADRLHVFTGDVTDER